MILCLINLIPMAAQLYLEWLVVIYSWPVTASNKTGDVAIWDIPLKLALNSNLTKSRPSVILKSLWNFAQSPIVTAVLCAKLLDDLATETRHQLWTKEISRELNLWCVSYRYPTFSNSPGVQGFVHSEELIDELDFNIHTSLLWRHQWFI